MRGEDRRGENISMHILSLFKCNIYLSFFLSLSNGQVYEWVGATSDGARTGAECRCLYLG